jgi:hypothetical protein
VNFKKPLLIASLAGLIWCCGHKTEQAAAVSNDSTTITKAPEPVVYKDTALDNKARYIAGLSQLETNSYTALEKDPFWIKYKTSVDTSWNKMVKNRLSKMSAWETATLSKSVNDSLPLFYPFSGPDFLHANYLYPHTKEFMLGALESIISIPSLDSMKAPIRAKFLDSLNHSLRDIFNKSYFITTHMQKDMKKIRGVLPPLYFFIERSGHEMLEQKFITIDSAGNEKEVKHNQIHWQKVPGIKLVFRHRETHQIKTLYYFNLDISNSGLKKKPQFVKFVLKRVPYNTFVKSASYLMHNPVFSDMRDLILTHSQSLFQDDTGIAWKDIKRRMDVNTVFFGEYIRPVKDFGDYTFQRDLDSAYKASPNKQDLPFSLGYHWETKKQNYMLITKTGKISAQK